MKKILKETTDLGEIFFYKTFPYFFVCVLSVLVFTQPSYILVHNCTLSTGHTS